MNWKKEFVPWKRLGFEFFVDDDMYAWLFHDGVYTYIDGPWMKKFMNMRLLVRWLERNIPRDGDVSDNIKTWGPEFLGHENIR